MYYIWSIQTGLKHYESEQMTEVLLLRELHS